MTVDVSDATVDGDHCEALKTISPGGAYDVRFENGNLAQGRYWLTVGDGDSNSNIGSGTNPEWEPVVYSVTVDFRYQSSTVDYVTPIRVAPGEIE